MKIYVLFIAILSILFFSSCEKKDKTLICTEEYRTVTIEVNGAILDDFYTIRKKNGDTIRYTNYSNPGNNFYPVLEDDYSSIIKQNTTEKFIFRGIIQDYVVVDEEFLISSDGCHINYESGELVVNL